MWKDYRRFLTKPPRLVVEWTDEPTGARAWLVVNSLRGGACGGGTRMRKGVTREEVTYLAKAMELKFAFSGPPIGGAKSGIDFDPRDSRKHDVLRRWFEVAAPYLDTCYGTGGDVNVDEQREVVPLCRELGLRHHQQGVLRGHLRVDDRRLDEAVLSIGEGVQAPVPDVDLGPGARTVSDMITGWGVVHAAQALAVARSGGLEGKRIVIEGFGNVGGSAALYFAREGASVVAIVDRERAAIREGGLDAETIEDLLRRRCNGLLPEDRSLEGRTDREAAYHVPADIFVPAAISGSVTQQRLLDLRAAGVSTIVCGANKPFREVRLGDTDTLEAADHAFDVVPDVIGGLGMACAFHHFMSGAEARSAADVFEVVRETVQIAIRETVERRGHPHGGLIEAAYAIAMERVAEEGRSPVV